MPLPARTAALAALLLCTTLLTPAFAAGEDAQQAVAIVENLHATLLGVMKEADALGYEGRRARLEPVLEKSFDLGFMAQKSVGRHWKELSEDQQQKLLATFRDFTIANYAGRFDGWTGQSFETLEEEPSTHGTLIVHTRLVDPGDEDVQLNYRLRPSNGSWRIIDVYLNGTVSELALRRSENSSLISREGFDALIARLQERIAELAAGKGGDEDA